MKYIFKEYPGGDYDNYEFPFQVYCQLEDSSETDEVLGKGFLPTRIENNMFYLARSLRLKINEFVISSENKRILAKTEYLSVESKPLSKFEYTYEIGKFALEYYEKKFGKKLISAQKLKWIFTSGFFTDVLIYSEQEKIVGYCPVIKTKKSLVYAYPFYDMEYAKQNIGMGMMLKAILYSQEQNLEHIYLGTCYTKGSKYKLQFNALEFFYNNEWEYTIDNLKSLINVNEIRPSD